MKHRWWVLMLLGLLMGLFFYFDLGRFNSLEMLKKQHEALQQAYHAQPVWFIACYAATYIVMAALAIAWSRLTRDWSGMAPFICLPCVWRRCCHSSCSTY